MFLVAIAYLTFSLSLLSPSSVIRLCKVSKYQKNIFSADSFLYRICAKVCSKNQSYSMKRASLVSPSAKSLHGLYLGEIFQTWSVGHAPRN